MTNAAAEFIQPILLFGTPYNAIQAGAVAFGETSPSRYSLINKAKNIFLGIDALTLIGPGILLISKVSDNYKIDQFYTNAEVAIGSTPAFVVGMTASFIGLFILGIAVFGTANEINKYMKPQSASSEFNWERPVDEFFKQAALISHIFINVAFTYFIPEYGAFFALNAAIEGFVLLKISQRKWLKFEKSVDCVNEYFSKITATYHFLVQTSKVEPEEKCTVCFEDFNEENKKPVNFCSSHKFHVECINDMVKVSADNFLHGLNAKQRTVVTTYNNKGGSSTHVHYKIDLSKSAIPCCPLCRERPNHHEFDIDFGDKFHASSTHIDWIEA